MFVDSSGTAVDRNLSRAIEAACAEFIERQSIIAHWRLSTPGRPIDRPCYFSNGECSLRDVSIFPGIYVVLALFRRNKGSCSVVKYSAGASSSTNLNEATDKAVRECHQAYLSMQDNVFRRATGRLLMDRIQEEYLNANKATTVDCWPRLTSTESKLHTAHVNTGTALSVLQSVLEPPLLILDSIFYDGEPWYVARLMSDIWPAGLHDNRPSAIKALVRLTGIEECRHDAVPFG
ncbi:YcaO-like family protein [Gleimia hominis]|uniref:YcaO-like family protein n=1 Tax=Gleimia hominis TaxID=595468 RepID=UPI0035E46214